MRRCARRPRPRWVRELRERSGPRGAARRYPRTVPDDELDDLRSRITPEKEDDVANSSCRRSQSHYRLCCAIRSRPGYPARSASLLHWENPSEDGPLRQALIAASATGADRAHREVFPFQVV
jgi:hypothetical protein